MTFASFGDDCIKVGAKYNCSRTKAQAREQRNSLKGREFQFWSPVGRAHSDLIKKMYLLERISKFLSILLVYQMLLAKKIEPWYYYYLPPFLTLVFFPTRDWIEWGRIEEELMLLAKMNKKERRMKERKSVEYDGSIPNGAQGYFKFEREEEKWGKGNEENQRNALVMSHGQDEKE